MIDVASCDIKIWVGFKEQYDGPIHNLDELRKICQDFVDKVKLCVTINSTEFIYVNGNEPGAWIGLIQYPRFPKEEYQLIHDSFELARIIMKKFGQYRVSVVTRDKTYMFENPNLIKMK